MTDSPVPAPTPSNLPAGLPTSPRISKWRTFHFYATIVIVLGVLAMLGYFGWYIYRANQGLAEVDNLARALRTADERAAAARRADTVGGNTPQETLELYIAAVERGNYEQASKYFVIENQEKELNSLLNAPRENLENMIVELKKGTQSEGGYSRDKMFYEIEDPAFIQFYIYPSGVWKIVEI